MASEYTIGELARAADVANSTLRYYERRGLVEPNSRSQGNYRLYSAEALERVRFIRAAQATGFTLDDVAMLLDLRVAANAPCEDVQVLMEERLENVKSRMAELQHVQSVLTSFLEKCRTTKRRGHCAVIEELNAACCLPPATTTDNVPKIAQALKDSGVESRFADQETKLRLRLLQLVAKGRPVSKTLVAKTARELGIDTDPAMSLVRTVSELDSRGRVVGILGLSQEQHPHRFLIDGHVLFTWCAWDALFLPVLLKMSAEVESVCPVTKRNIRLSVTPRRVEQSVPRDTVLSMLIPKLKGSDPPSAKQVMTSFCQHVQFFSSRHAAKRWSARRKGLRILSVDEGHELGRQVFVRDRKE